MEEFSVIIAIVILIVSMLQIILFFRIWKMTNDTAEINKKLDRLLTKRHLPDSVKPIQRVLERRHDETDDKPVEVDIVKEEAKGGGLGFLIVFAVLILIGVIILIMGLDV